MPIGRLIHERIDLSTIGEAQFEHPCGLFRIGIDHGGIGDDAVIGLDNFTAHRRIHLRSRFYQLDNGNNLAFCHGAADLRQLDVNEIAKLRLRVSGNADGRNVAVNVQPLVVLGEFASYLVLL